jgi:chromosome segregation ATPase
MCQPFWLPSWKSVKHVNCASHLWKPNCARRKQCSRKKWARLLRSAVGLRSQIERAETALLAAGEEAAALKTQLHDAQSVAPELVAELQQERAALEEERARCAALSNELEELRTSYIHFCHHGESATSRGWR